MGSKRLRSCCLDKKLRLTGKYISNEAYQSFLSDLKLDIRAYDPVICSDQNERE